MLVMLVKRESEIKLTDPLRQGAESGAEVHLGVFGETRGADY